MKNWKLSLNITRFDDGFSLEARLPGSDVIMIHRDTKDEILTVLANNLSAKIDEIEGRLNPPE